MAGESKSRSSAKGLFVNGNEVAFCPSATAGCAAAGQYWFHFVVGASNDVSGNEAITDPLAGISSSTNSGIHGTGFTTHHHRDAVSYTHLTLPTKA